MHDQLLLSATRLAQWQHPVASIEALDLDFLYQVMHSVLYWRTTTAIKMASKNGVFLLIFFFMQLWWLLV